MNTDCPSSNAVQQVAGELQALCGERISTASGVCRPHGRGEGFPAVQAGEMI